MNAAASGTRLVYQTAPFTQPVRLSGTPWLNLRMAFSKPKANLTGILISYPAAGGNGTILSRGWLDPENRHSDRVSEPIVPGTFYDLRFDLQPKDIVVPAGRRLAVMILSSDFEHTLRPAPGTQLTLDTAASSVQLPIVGGGPALSAADGDPYAEATADAPVGGTVPATLSLTLGAPASFGAFAPGVAKEYTASTTANVTSSAGDAALSVLRPRPPDQRRVLAATAAAGDDRAGGVGRAGVQRRGGDRLQAGDRRERRPAHRGLLEDPHVHALNDHSVTTAATVIRRSPPRCF